MAIEKDISSMENKSVESSIYGSDYFLYPYDNDPSKYLEELKNLPISLSICFNLAKPNTGEKLLDLGCGRGHLSYFCALKRCSITAVDYSEDAIKLTEFAKEKLPSELRNNLTIIKGSITGLQLSDKFDVIFMADLVEHLYDWELKNLFEKVKSWLKEDSGRLIIHTAPNALWIKYIYPLKRILGFSTTIRKRLNFFYKRDRFSYSTDMHVNEQTPRNLKKLLKDFDSKIWCDDGSSNVISILTKKFAGADIWAIAKLKGR